MPNFITRRLISHPKSNSKSHIEFPTTKTTAKTLFTNISKKKQLILNLVTKVEDEKDDLDTCLRRSSSSQMNLLNSNDILSSLSNELVDDYFVNDDDSSFQYNKLSFDNNKAYFSSNDYKDDANITSNLVSSNFLFWLKFNLKKKN